MRILATHKRYKAKSPLLLFLKLDIIFLKPLNRLSVLYQTSSPKAGRDIRLIFKRSKTGLDLVFFFSKSVRQTKTKEFSLLYP